MKIKDIVANENVKIYEINKAIQSPSMFGAMLYKGSAMLLKSQMLERKVFRWFFDGYETHIIVC